MAFRIYTPQVGTAAAPGYRQRIVDQRAEGAAALAQGATRAADGASRLYEQVHDEQDAAAIQEAYTKLATARQSLLDDPENGYVTTRKGKTAIAERGAVLKYYDDYSRQVLEGLNEGQRAQFQRVHERDRLGFVDSLDRHMARESEALAEQALDGALTAARSDAAGAAARGEMDKVPEAIGMGVGAIDRRAAAHGWAPEFADAKRKEFATRSHLGVLEHLIETRPAYAEVYLDAHRSQMDGALVAQSKIDELIAAANLRENARELADKVWVEAGGDPAAAVGVLRDRGVRDTKLLDETMQRITQRAGVDEQARRLADSPRLGRLEQNLLRRGFFTEQDPDFIRLSDPGKADALRMLWAERRARRERGSRERSLQNETDRYLLAYFNGLDLVGDQGDDKVSIDVDSGPFLDGSRTLRETVRAAQKAAQRNVAKDNGVSAQEFKQLTETRLLEIRSKSDREEVRKFVNGFYARHLNDPANKGLPPAQELVDGWIANWFTVHKKPWYQRDVFAVQEQIESGAASSRPPVGAATAASSGRVRVRRADGATGSIPADKVDAFLAANPGAEVLP